MVEILIVGAEDSVLIDQVRNLFWEYQDSLEVDLQFQGFQQELDGLPGKYSQPQGQLLLVHSDAVPAACGAFRAIDSDVCEMKRLYVRQSARGLGLGRRVAQRLIRDAATAGYKKMRLDTLAGMTEARALYDSLGFYSIEPYYYSPENNVAFLELDLTSSNVPDRGVRP